MVKPRLLILADLFGGENPEWIKSYTNLLESKFDVQYYDVLELGDIDKSDFVESNLHDQFLNGGIDKAVETLLKLEKGEVTILGFSIGGTIAWKASSRELNTTCLYAVSSTRLRYENESPNCELKLYFGEKDLNKPNLQWFLDLGVSNEIFENQNHQFYLDKNIASLISNKILGF